MKLAVALGANLGDPAATLRAAVSDMRLVGRVQAVSSLYRSAPVGGPPQPAYLNAVLIVETELLPLQVLEILQGIEQRHGRVRHEQWGPRTLDLDVIASDAGSVALPPDLVVPHPRARTRRFVLEPLVEVWPDVPLGGTTAAQALAESADQDVARLPGRDWYTDPGRGAGWVIVQGVLFVAAVGAAFLDQGSLGVGAWMVWIGWGLILAGGIEMALGLRALGRNLTAFPEPIAAGRLIRAGIYRRVRHPLYGANVLLITGLAASQQTVVGLVVAATATGFFWAKAGHEEERLVRRYADYEEYRSAVPKRLIPWIL